MNIQRTDNELIIRLPTTVNIDGIQRLLDLLTYQEIAAKSHVSQKQVDELASEINKSWWERNANRFTNP